MNDFNHIPEPEVDPLADTNPSLSIRPVDLQARQPMTGWQRAAGLFSLLGAVVLTLAAVVLLLLPKSSPETVPPLPTQPVMETVLPTDMPPTAVIATGDQPIAAIPTASSDLVSAVLNAPLQRVNNISFPVIGAPLDPFTIIPDRPRSEALDYTVVQGDTIYSIAERYNLQPETIAWANSRDIIRVLIPGDVITVPPTDGVYIATIGSKTLAEIATQYKADVYSLIDYEPNSLFGVNPDLIPESGTRLMIPGGEAEPITWNPAVVEETGTGSGGTSNTLYVTFAPGDAGSCGKVENTGGTYWTNPLPGSTWMRGFTSWHTGVDLAAVTGTPVYAANGGRVVFAGWNSWGYGNTVVLAHGPFMTLYGHMSSISVGCNAWVDAGSVIGGVGSTGNSSGPHLHFEIRYNNVPTDPAATIGF